MNQKFTFLWLGICFFSSCFSIHFSFHLNLIAYAVCLSLTCFPQYGHLQAHLCGSEWHYFIPLYGCSIPLSTPAVPSRTHLLMDSLLASASWLLEVVLQWRWGSCVFPLRDFIRYMPRSGISDHAVALISFLKEPPSYRLQWLLPGYVPTQSIAEIFSTMLSPKSVLVDFWGFFPQIKHTTKPTGLLPFLLLTCRSSLYVLDINPF